MRSLCKETEIGGRNQVNACDREPSDLEHLEDEGSPAIVPRTLLTGSPLGLFEVDRQTGDATSEPR